MSSNLLALNRINNSTTADAAPVDNNFVSIQNAINGGLSDRHISGDGTNPILLGKTDRTLLNAVFLLGKDAGGATRNLAGVTAGNLLALGDAALAGGSWVLGTLAAAGVALALTATFNNAAAAMTGLQLNVTDTASSAVSLLADLQVGGASKFKVDKSGNVTSLGGATLSGALTLYQNGIAVTATDAALLANTTAATAGAPAQYSPSLHLQGTGWDTGALASKSVDARLQVVPTGGNPVTSTVQLQSSIGGGAWANILSVTSAGVVTVPGNLTVNGAGTSAIAGSLSVNGTLAVGGTGTTSFSGPLLVSSSNAVPLAVNYSSASAWSAGRFQRSGATRYDVLLDANDDAAFRTVTGAAGAEAYTEAMRLVNANGNLNVGSGVLYVDRVNSRVGVMTTTPGAGFAFDVVGAGRFSLGLTIPANQPLNIGGGVGTNGQVLTSNGTGAAWAAAVGAAKINLTAAPTFIQDFGWGADNEPAWQDLQGAVWGVRDQVRNLAAFHSWDADSADFTKSVVGSGSVAIGGGRFALSSGATASSTALLRSYGVAAPSSGVNFGKKLEISFWATFSTAPDANTTAYFGVGYTVGQYARFKVAGANITLEYYNGVTVTTSANIAGPPALANTRNNYRIVHVPTVGVYFFVNDTLVNPGGFGAVSMPSGLSAIDFEAQIGNGATAATQNLFFGPVTVINK